MHLYSNRLMNTIIIVCAYYNMIVNIECMQLLYYIWRVDGRKDRPWRRFSVYNNMTRTHVEERIHPNACCTRWYAKTSAARGFLPLTVGTDCACGGYVGVSLWPPPRCGDPSTRPTFGTIRLYTQGACTHGSCVPPKGPVSMTFSFIFPTDNHRPSRVVRQSYPEKNF